MHGGLRRVDSRPLSEVAGNLAYRANLRSHFTPPRRYDERAVWP